MDTKTIEVTILYDYTLEKLLDKKRYLISSYLFNVLLVIIMRYQKVHIEEASRILVLSKPMILNIFANEIKLEWKPTLSTEAEQLALKKVKNLLDIVENSSNRVLYDLDETYVKQQPTT